MKTRKKNKPIVRAALIYILLTTGMWMFTTAYANSYNHLSTEKISTASLILNKKTAEMKILEHSFVVDIEPFLPESRLYYVMYLAAPDEVRLAAAGISFIGSLECISW